MKELNLKKYLFLLLLVNSSFINCSFQISLFNQLNKRNKGKNLTISPLSLFQAISLVTNGANGDTQTELLKLLDDKGMEEINEINFKILSKLKEITTLEMGNAIMTKLSPLYKFSKFVTDKYNAEIQPLKNVNQVNKWCDNKTHGKIKEIIDKLDGNIFMIILNVVYFKGIWLKKFSDKLTSKQLFYNYNLESYKKEVDTMEISSYYFYFQDSNLQAIQFDYEKDSMSALIILPKKELDINEFINIFNDDNDYLYTIINNSKNCKVNVQMPKFEITFKENLKQILKEMGVNLAFDKNADFTNIRSQNDLLIDEIIHKTYLKVDEGGTEAAAVTAIKMGLKMSMAPREEITYYMIINRPFLFIIRNKNFPKNNDIIFISKIEEIN